MRTSNFALYCVVSLKLVSLAKNQKNTKINKQSLAIIIEELKKKTDYILQFLCLTQTMTMSALFFIPLTAQG